MASLLKNKLVSFPYTGYIFFGGGGLKCQKVEESLFSNNVNGIVVKHGKVCFSQVTNPIQSQDIAHSGWNGKIQLKYMCL